MNRLAFRLLIYYTDIYFCSLTCNIIEQSPIVEPMNFPFYFILIIFLHPFFFVWSHILIYQTALLPIHKWTINQLASIQQLAAKQPNNRRANVIIISTFNSISISISFELMNSENFFEIYGCILWCTADW